jgi:hypothetical protein
METELLDQVRELNYLRTEVQILQSVSLDDLKAFFFSEVF